jgi:hypothetical protein
MDEGGRGRWKGEHAIGEEGRETEKDETGGLICWGWGIRSYGI